MLAFGDLLGAAVMIAEVDIDILDLFAVELGNQAQHAMGPGMMGAEVEDHRLVIDALHLLAAEETLRIARHHLHRRFRRKRLHLGGAADMLLAQRVPLPVVGHEDAPQIRMTLEIDAEHVEDLALVPVGRGPNVGQRRRRRHLSMQWHLDPHISGVVVGHQMVNQGEIVVRAFATGALVDCGQVLEPTVFRRCLLLEEAQQVGGRLRVGPVGRHVDTLGVFTHLLAEPVVQRLAQVRG